MPEFVSSSFGENTVGNEDGDLISIFEIARNDIMNEFANISVEAGYRNNIADVVNAIRAPYKITETPEIGVVIGNRDIAINDSTWNSSDIRCNVYVQGVVEAEDVMEKSSTILNTKMESLAHDMTRVIHGFITKNINNYPRGRWNVDPTQKVRIIMGIDFGDKVTKGVVRAEFIIQLRAVDETYA